MSHLLFFDSETQRIGPGSIAPPMICGIFTVLNDAGDGYETRVLGNHPDDGLESMLEWMLTDDEVKVVTQRGGFDYAVICNSFPRLIPLVYAKLIAGLATDTMWREKLLNLSTTGRLDNMVLPDGSTKRISYSMEAMAGQYLGLDLSEDKGNIEESWRANYGTLDGWRAADYPEDAYRYAKDDGEHTADIYFAQEDRMQNFSFASVETEEFQIVKDFVLYMMSAWGMETDPEATEAMSAQVDEVMEQTKDLLEASGILRGEGRFGQPYAKDMDRALDLILQEYGADFYNAWDEQSEDWTEVGQFLADNGVKMKKPKGKVGSMNQAALQAHLAALYKRLGEIPPMTEGGEKGEPQIKCDAEVQEYLALKDPVMEQYHQRMSLGKLKNQMIPVLQSGPVVYPSYDAIKETGRTSSYDGGKRKENGQEIRLYPSVNIQQIPNEIKGLDPRRCFRPRAGTVFFDVDFTGLELACVGHVTYELFGESVHRDLYNAGIDLHGYLGAQLGLKSSPRATSEKPWLPTLTRDFQTAVREEGIISDPMAVYEAFKLLKGHDDKDVQAFFKHYRSFAKPVGLGFPGGLGPATMVEFARKTYGVTMTEEEAFEYREFWRATYPEMPRFFDWINGQTDPYNGSGDGSSYVYTTPMGLVRRGASFCAAANGMCMQSPGAEAAMMGAILVSRACYDPTQGSILYGCRPIAFVHDQLIGETTKDSSLWAAQCEEVARLMREGAEMVLTSIKMRTDEALLTAVWTKAAEPVRDPETKELQVWRPAA
jgi:hypothetical protein